MAKVDIRFERDVLDGFGRILFTDRDLASAASAVEGAYHRLEEVPAVVVKHKVTTIASQNVDRLVEGNLIATDVAKRLSAALKPDLDIALAHRDLLHSQVSEVAKITGACGLSWSQVTILKGFSNARFYPAPYRRWMRDIDLFTESWRDAHVLVEALIALGYEFDVSESPWVKADHPNRRPMYGQVFLIRPDGRDMSRVDLHFGTYSVGYAGYLGTPLRDLSTTMHLVSGDVGVLRPEGCIILAQAHALSDGYVSIKDINDFVAMASSGEEIDWQRVGAELRAHELGPQAHVLATRCLELYDDSLVVQAAELLKSSTGLQRRTIWRTHDRSWRLRAAVNASFAYRWERRVRRAPALRSLGAAIGCYLFYVRRLKLEVRNRSLVERLLHRLMPKPSLRDWRLRPDACTLLIDAGVVRSLADRENDAEAVTAVPVDEGIEVVSTGRYDFLRLNGRMYVPTLDLLIEPDQAAAVPHG